jgi:hypothetical protein
MSGLFCGRCGAEAGATSRGAWAERPDTSLSVTEPEAETPDTQAVPATPVSAAAPATYVIPPRLDGPGARFIGMWNWGAFLLTPWWLMNHKRPWRGILYLLLLVIPLASIGMAIAYGVVGNRVAVESGRFADEAQFVAVQNAWRNWGFIIAVTSFVLAVPIAIIDVAVTPVAPPSR